MPRYFFHRIDGGFDPDHEGTVCDDPRSARLEAIRYATKVVGDDPDYLWNGSLRIQVNDEAGYAVTTIILLAVDSLQPKR